MLRITKKSLKRLLKDRALVSRKREGPLKIIGKDPDFKRRVLEAALLDPSFQERIVEKLRDTDQR